MNVRRQIFEIVEREHPITVRGAFYRAVSAGIYPGTHDKYYQKCVKLLQQMRAEERIGNTDIPYEWIVDSSRSREGGEGYASLGSFITDVPDMYCRNYWLDQPIHIEVMTEKDAMATILKPVIDKWNVPFTVFRGNPSDTMCHSLGKLFKSVSDQREEEDSADVLNIFSEMIPVFGDLFQKQIVVLYLGDFDPSGLNISRVAKRKIERFANREISWSRVAINKAQFERMQAQFGIPVKPGDKLAPNYRQRHGNLCVEVDAIPSNEVRQLLETAIVKHVDMEIWKESQAIEKEEQRRLDKLVSKMNQDKS